MNSKQTKKNFENALFQALRSHGLLRPDKGEQEDGATENLLPAELQNANVFVQKEAKVIPLKPNRNKTTKRSQYAKVAMKKGVKGKNKKKK
jgi:hypothetical protein